MTEIKYAFFLIFFVFLSNAAAAYNLNFSEKYSVLWQKKKQTVSFLITRAETEPHLTDLHSFVFFNNLIFSRNKCELSADKNKLFYECKLEIELPEKQSRDKFEVILAFTGYSGENVCFVDKQKIIALPESTHRKLNETLEKYGVGVFDPSGKYYSVCAANRINLPNITKKDDFLFFNGKNIIVPAENLNDENFIRKSFFDENIIDGIIVVNDSALDIFIKSFPQPLKQMIEDTEYLKLENNINDTYEFLVYKNSCIEFNVINRSDSYQKLADKYQNDSNAVYIAALIKFDNKKIIYWNIEDARAAVTADFFLWFEKIMFASLKEIYDNKLKLNDS